MDKFSRLRNQFYPESKFGGYIDADGTLLFYGRIRALLTPDSCVLDIGCGPRTMDLRDESGARREARNLKRTCRTVIGIDVDPSAAANPYITEFRQITAADLSWPVESESIDLCYSDCVLEHVANPHDFFSECARVIKPGGYLCLRTPNLCSYPAMFSCLIPYRFHGTVLRWVQPSRQTDDVYPTYYRCNRIGKIRRTLTAYGFAGVVYGHESEPAYLGFSWITYAFGVVHQKFAPHRIKPSIFVFAQKGGSS